MRPVSGRTGGMRWRFPRCCSLTWENAVVMFRKSRERVVLVREWLRTDPELVRQEQLKAELCDFKVRAREADRSARAVIAQVNILIAKIETPRLTPDMRKSPG